jgi:hypothetical protein
MLTAIGISAWRGLERIQDGANAWTAVATLVFLVSRRPVP